MTTACRGTVACRRIQVEDWAGVGERKNGREGRST